MTYVYRLYDAAGALLYVGQSGRPGVRFDEHRTLSVFGDLIARMDIAHYPNRPAGIAAEAAAIVAEAPRFNQLGRRVPRDAVRAWYDDRHKRGRSARRL